MFRRGDCAVDCSGAAEQQAAGAELQRWCRIVEE